MSDQVPALVAEGVSVEFGRGRRRLRAVSDVSLAVEPGRTLAIVGESGSGKSTVARAMAGLVPLHSGRVSLLGETFARPSRAQRRNIQMVFQDPFSSLDPSSSVGSSLAEPLIVHERMSRVDRSRRIAELLDDVGLPRDSARRYPHEFSGGQRQRIAIARAIATHPKVLLLDEAVSALDVSTQNQILVLLNDLQARYGLAYVFISHNLGVVRWIADETLVMYMGHVVERGPTERVHTSPEHPYTKALIAAMPIADPSKRDLRARVLISGEAPDQFAKPKGCIFASRCRDVTDACTSVPPMPTPLTSGGAVACHLTAPELALAGAPDRAADLTLTTEKS